jgi:hypothetical protein
MKPERGPVPKTDGDYPTKEEYIKWLQGLTPDQRDEAQRINQAFNGGARPYSVDVCYYCGKAGHILFREGPITDMQPGGRTWFRITCGEH